MMLFTYIDDLMHIQFADVKDVDTSVSMYSKSTVSDYILDFNNIIIIAHAFRKINGKNTI